MSSEFKVTFVVGPTASGKSQWAYQQAQKIIQGGQPAAIINCDSIQVYQGLDIGSSKPSIEERKSLPHYLFDYVPTGQVITAGSYSRDFFDCCEKIKSQYSQVFVVGGTGFYFQAIEKGMYDVGAADREVLEQIEQEIKTNPEAVYKELLQKDPVAAQRISSHDHYRLARAIEMMRTHGKSVTQIQQEFASAQRPFPYKLDKVGLWAERDELLPRVKKRTEKMLREGLLEEVELLLKRGYEHWPPLRSVGYREAVDYLLKKSAALSLDELAEQITTSTLQLAKKQRTWFKRDLQIRWQSCSDTGL
jgi:tRNA dimethylallyltransferase